MAISVQSNSEAKKVTINISQQFDYSLHQSFRDAYRNTNQAGTTFTLNLSQATYMDSSALGMILLLKEHAEKIGGRVVIEKPNESVRKILTIANFDQFVTIEN